MPTLRLPDLPALPMWPDSLDRALAELDGTIREIERLWAMWSDHVRQLESAE